MRKFLYAFLLFGVFYFSIMMITCGAADHFDYEFTEDGGAVLTKYTGRDTVVDVPSELGGVPVREIGPEAFLGCQRITAVVLPESVLRIGDYAFEYCASLTDVEIPEGVVSLGIGAFKNCSAMRTADLPESLSAIGGSAFENCTALERIEIPRTNRQNRSLCILRMRFFAGSGFPGRPGGNL